MERLDAETAIAAFDHWYHRIEVYPGVFTPGIDDTPGKLDILNRLGFPADCHGLRVLDVGTCDGAFAFEAERRGAEVTALDVSPVDQTGFELARALLGASTVYQQRTVYSVDPATDGCFDVVLFLGILYHLRHPLLALDRLRQVIQPGGLMLIDTHSIQLGLSANDRLSIDTSTLELAARPHALWQTFVDHQTPYIGFSPNVTALREVLYKTQWRMSEQLYFVGSRLYTAAYPDINPAVEQHILADGLRL